MNIALLTEKYTPDIGGLAISSERIARLLTSTGHNIRVFSPTLNLLPSEKQIHNSNGVSVTRFGISKRMDDTLVDWFELIVEEHKREPFDVLQAYFLPKAGFVATYAGKYLNIPSIVSIRGNDIERAAFDPVKFSHVIYALQNASTITTNAKELAKKAKAFVNKEVHIIPNGVDTDHFKPTSKNNDLANALGLGNDPVIGFVGELRKKKGLETLLPAYAQTCEQHPMTLLIIGEVRQGDDKNFFDQFQLANPNLHIIVTGYIPYNDLPSYYSLIDILVHPSLRDGMPNAILEAMACEIPVIATPVGGIKDILQNETNGITVHINDETMLTEKIIELLNNPKKQISLGKNARKIIINKFMLEKELQANLNIYQSLGIKI